MKAYFKKIKKIKKKLEISSIEFTSISFYGI